MSFFKKLLNPGFSEEIEALARNATLSHEEKCKAIASVIGAIYSKDRKRGMECSHWFGKFQVGELKWTELEMIHFQLYHSAVAMKTEAAAEQKPNGKWSFSINSDSVGKIVLPSNGKVVTTIKPDGSKTLVLRSVAESSMAN